MSLISFYNTWKHQKARGFHLHLTDGALQPFKTWCPSNGQTHIKNKKKKATRYLTCFWHVFLTFWWTTGVKGLNAFLFYQGFLSQILTILQDSRGSYLFLSTTFARSRKFRYLFATLHVRWLPHIFNCIACNYWAASQWDLSP